MSNADVDSPGEWTNEPLELNSLARVDPSSFTALDPAYRRMRTATALATSVAAVIAMLFVGTTVAHLAVWLAAGAVTLVVVAASVIHRLEVDRMGYLVRAHDLSFSSGLIGRSVATAPFARVQHISIARGPIDRRFGLAALTVRTAGGSITVPGLAVERAERLKLEVTDRAASLAAAEIEPDDDPPVAPLSHTPAGWPSPDSPDSPDSVANRGDAADD